MLDDSALYQMLVNNFGHIFNLDLAVKSTLRVNNDYRTERAQTEAARSDNLDFICKTFFCNLFFKLSNYLCAV